MAQRVDEHDKKLACRVFSSHLDDIQAAGPLAEKAVQRLLRSLRRRTIAMRRVHVVPPLPPCDRTEPSLQQLQSMSNGHRTDPRRSVAASAKLLSRLRAWRLKPAMRGIVTPERARARVKNERAGVLTFPRDLHFRDALVHKTVLPTLTASDHYFDVYRWQWLSPREVAIAFGVPTSSAFFAGLAFASSVMSPKQLVAALGRSVCVPTLQHVIHRAVSSTLAPPTGEGARTIKYGSLFSGLDLSAVALEALVSGPPGGCSSKWLSGCDFEYVFAAERDESMQAILSATWGRRGLTDDRVYDDARLLARNGAPWVDLAVITSECGEFSRRKRAKERRLQANSLQDISDALDYVRSVRPRAVVIENVDEPSLVLFVDDLVGGIAGYRWERVVIDPTVHSEWPMHRRRCYWIGMRLDALRPGFLEDFPSLF